MWKVKRESRRGRRTKREARIEIRTNGEGKEDNRCRWWAWKCVEGVTITRKRKEEEKTNQNGGKE